jgi:hypothetical protein
MPSNGFGRSSDPGSNRFHILEPAPRAEAVLFSRLQRLVRRTGKALDEHFLLTC